MKTLDEALKESPEEFVNGFTETTVISKATTGTRTVWRYGVRVRGVKNRCRKVEWHTDAGKGIAESPALDRELAKSLARQWIAKHMKTFDKAYATATFWVIDGNVEHWEPFTDAHNVRIELD